MNIKIQPTNDGSATLRLEEMDETYHSTNGALTETQHVFIKNGLEQIKKEHVRILEVGFGTGLNAIATLDFLLNQKIIKSIHYTTLEKYPLNAEIISQLNYGSLFPSDRSDFFLKMHKAKWEEDISINEVFSIHKKKFDLLTEELEGEYDLIYYDAFAPSKQAEMWDEAPLNKVINTMAPESIFSTYCAKGTVRRHLQSRGLQTSRVPGPPGKREMLVARKLISDM